MDALRLLFEGLLALSAIGFFICACLADDSDNEPLPGRRATNVSTVVMQVSMVSHV